MVKSTGGQAAVEYVLVLVLFTGTALSAWRFLYPAISSVYQQFAARRADTLGMLP